MSRLKAHIRPSARPQPQPPPPPPSTTTTKSFNSTINRLSSAGSHRDVLTTFSTMLNCHTPPDAHTYPCLFKACTFLNKFSFGILLHQRIIIHGYSSDSYISSSLINFYSKFGRVKNAHNVFDLMPERNVVPWTSLIGCYMHSGDVNKAFRLYNLMRYEGISPSSVTMLNILSGVSEIPLLECLHATVVQFGLISELNLVNCMLNLYGKCGRMKAARDLFEAMFERDIVSWNSLVSGYAQDGNFEEILKLFKRMKSDGTIGPDQQTFGTLLSASETFQTDVDLGRLIHGQIITCGLQVDAHLATSLVVLYSKCGNVCSAFRVFERVLEKDVILWTSVISAFVQNDSACDALMVFRQMLGSCCTPSTSTIATVIAACAKMSSLLLGKSVHAYLLRQRMTLDIPVQNSLITMYAKCGHLRQSHASFDSMSERDIVSWNAIVAAYAQNGDLWQALCLLNEMRSTLQQPDYITIISLLQACASTGALQQGKWIHSFVTRTFSQTSIMVGTALVDMYSKCGDLKTAHKCFNQMPKHDIVSWSTIITGYGSHGKGEMALKLYSDFLISGNQPNHVIFLSVLFSCSHNGMVSEGLSLFNSMTRDFGIKPELEHRACIVDLLCRAGKIGEAYEFIWKMFSNPTTDVLGILLDACRMKGDAKLGEIVARDIMMLKPACAGNYVQLAHSFASMNRWEGVNDAWNQMKVLGLKKLPGWSYTQQHGEITTFFNGQSDHPLNEEMMWVMEILGYQMEELRFNFNLSSCDLNDIFNEIDV
ncbi:pentatricopeptide repeat-containing protein At4g04370 [Spinacia oleracea]|uniref:Pentatricopeptide repeat-containing protein At4g04370 n=1 Tax=Spinacia oleracea TaxID=3562 RepID=A0A9R0HV97_SPIOL|nr:pentatricopeptide repeat-containing protein At4g04370 [Spinacia oleracea]XP_056689202.1 pentatricopeptide repeat-containing protein At4g04370 [Spinacia oleracea]